MVNAYSCREKRHRCTFTNSTFSPRTYLVRPLFADRTGCTPFLGAIIANGADKGSDVVGGSHVEAAKHTLFSLTNETLNAWTTIISFVLVNVLYFKTR